MTERRRRSAELVPLVVGTNGSEVEDDDRCPRGMTEANWAHNFEAYGDERRSPVIYCSQCGRVRKLEITP